jgi:ATP-dependent Zn protease
LDEATAYHEAGHAVLALALGRPVHAVSILPSRERLGECEYRKPRLRPAEDWLEREILIALGGVAAEARFTGTFVREMAATDLRYVHDLAAQRVGQRRAERLERRLLAKAEHLLSQEGHWRAVELIAAELMRCGTISGRAARHLFEQGTG